MDKHTDPNQNKDKKITDANADKQPGGVAKVGQPAKPEPSLNPKHPAGIDGAKIEEEDEDTKREQRGRFGGRSAQGED